MEKRKKNSYPYVRFSRCALYSLRKKTLFSIIHILELYFYTIIILYYLRVSKWHFFLRTLSVHVIVIVILYGFTTVLYIITNLYDPCWHYNIWNSYTRGNNLTIIVIQHYVMILYTFNTIWPYNKYKKKHSTNDFHNCFNSNYYTQSIIIVVALCIFFNLPLCRTFHRGITHWDTSWNNEEWRH